MENYVHNNTLPNTLANNQVNCCLIDSHGEIWAGTMNGLCKYNIEEDNFETIPLEIPSHNICSIIEDQHILWLTTTKGWSAIYREKVARYLLKVTDYKVTSFYPMQVSKLLTENLYRIGKRIQCFLSPSN